MNTQTLKADAAVTTRVTKRKPIPLGQKVAFGIGMLANQMFPAALGIFMVILVQSLGMSPVLWGLISFLPKLVDAVLDPLMGYISDRTQSRWGKRRPYIFIGAIIAGLSLTSPCGNCPQKTVSSTTFGTSWVGPLCSFSE